MIDTVRSAMVLPGYVGSTEAACIAPSLGRCGGLEDRGEVGLSREVLVDQIRLVRVLVRRRVAVLDVGLLEGVVDAAAESDAHQPVIVLAGPVNHERREEDCVARKRRD